MLSIPRKFTTDVAREMNRVVHRKKTKEGFQSSSRVPLKNSVGLTSCLARVLSTLRFISESSFHSGVFMIFVVKKNSQFTYRGSPNEYMSRIAELEQDIVSVSIDREPEDAKSEDLEKVQKLLDMLGRFADPIPKMTEIMEKAIVDIQTLMKKEGQ